MSGLDRSALWGMPAEFEALGLELLKVPPAQIGTRITNIR
jgi:hypothetical protein